MLRRFRCVQNFSLDSCAEVVSSALVKIRILIPASVVAAESVKTRVSKIQPSTDEL